MGSTRVIAEYWMLILVKFILFKQQGFSSEGNIKNKAGDTV